MKRKYLNVKRACHFRPQWQPQFITSQTCWWVVRLYDKVLNKADVKLVTRLMSKERNWRACDSTLVRKVNRQSVSQGLMGHVGMWNAVTGNCLCSSQELPQRTVELLSLKKSPLGQLSCLESCFCLLPLVWPLHWMFVSSTLCSKQLHILK